MEDLKQKQLEFLNDTINHFNSTNRGTDIDGKCSYSDGCAIGRHIDVALSRDIDSGKYGNRKGIGNDKVFNILPEKIKILGQEFLSHVQSLHDNRYHWNERGLSEEGQNRVDFIKKIFQL